MASIQTQTPAQTPAQTPPQARRRAILFVLGSSASFAAASGLVKVAAPEIRGVERGHESR